MTEKTTELKALEVDPQFLIPYDIKKDKLMGRLCEDTISGFKGYVVSRTIWLFGCSRVCLQGIALDKDNKPVLLTIDDWQCKTVRSTKKPLTIQTVKDAPKIILGSVVEDTISGLKGIAYGYNHLISGHVEVNVQPRILDPKATDKAPDAVWTLAGTLKTIEEAKFKPQAKPVTVMTRAVAKGGRGLGSGGPGRNDATPGRRDRKR